MRFWVRGKVYPITLMAIIYRDDCNFGGSFEIFCNFGGSVVILVGPEKSVVFIVGPL